MWENDQTTAASSRCWKQRQQAALLRPNRLRCLLLPFLKFGIYVEEPLSGRRRFRGDEREWFAQINPSCDHNTVCDAFVCCAWGLTHSTTSHQKDKHYLQLTYCLLFTLKHKPRGVCVHEGVCRVFPTQFARGAAALPADLPIRPTHIYLLHPVDFPITPIQSRMLPDCN